MYAYDIRSMHVPLLPREIVNLLNQNLEAWRFITQVS